MNARSRFAAVALALVALASLAACGHRPVTVPVYPTQAVGVIIAVQDDKEADIPLPTEDALHVTVTLVPSGATQSIPGTPLVITTRAPNPFVYTASWAADSSSDVLTEATYVGRTGVNLVCYFVDLKGGLLGQRIVVPIKVDAVTAVACAYRGA